MTQPLTRHLTEDELDLLLDDEAQVVTLALRAHVDACIECQQALRRAGEIVSLLDALPHPAPSGALSDRIMQEVHVFEPVSVTARDFVRHVVRPWVPARTTQRVALGVGAIAAALIGMVIGSVLLRNLDLGVLVAQVGLDRLVTLVGAALQEVATTVLGPATVVMTGTSTGTTMLLVIAGFAVTAGAVTLGLRALLRGARR
jgi:hypothetical protein